MLGITASEISLKNWIGEDSSGKFKMTKVDDCLDIVSPDGLTLWYDECLTGNYEISYRIKKTPHLPQENRLKLPKTLKNGLFTAK